MTLSRVRYIHLHVCEYLRALRLSPRDRSTETLGTQSYKFNDALRRQGRDFYFMDQRENLTAYHRLFT